MTGRRTNRTPLYSRSPVRTPAAAPPSTSPAGTGAPAPAAAPAGAPRGEAPRVAGARLARMPAWSWGVVGALAVAVPTLWSQHARGPSQVLTQQDIDRAVLHTLQTQPLPAAAAKAYEAVSGSVVRVVGRAHPPGGTEAPKNGDKAGGVKPKTEDQADDDEDGASVGSGVVIVDSGVILTNLHVVAGSRHIEVEFADGLRSEASVVNVMPENDLAVLRAHRIPDDLKSATMRSTGDLRPGDRVTAVGFPFGIGPSVSHGVVSGLKREFRSPEGEKVLTNLIQFDAMANPGSSGGPLVTDDGEVVGIVTAIYNPVQERFFVGIGFAVPIESAAAGAGLPPF
ncbi:MAG: S1C family serine protease [Burkholderiaceae bacterium]|nr:S1C family serine protease [Burkholderiaceae bacterium]